MINLGKVSTFGKEIILKERENGCLECISHCKDDCGYTRIMVNKKHERLFRYLYEKKYGKIEKGMVIRHKCDNPYCCNINHLEIGTPKDNAMDREKRNRGTKGKQIPSLRGINNKQHKLSEQQVIEIYTSKCSGKILSEKYNVSSSMIYQIKNNEWWSWLTKDLAR